MSVFLGSDKILPSVPWDETSPSFYSIKISCTEPNDILIQNKLERQYIYFLGSHMGCSCGLSVGEYEDYHESDMEMDQRERTMKAFKKYILNCLEISNDLRLYACWDGDEWKDIATVKKLSFADIDASCFWFEELQLLESIKI